MWGSLCDNNFRHLFAAHFLLLPVGCRGCCRQLPFASVHPGQRILFCVRFWQVEYHGGHSPTKKNEKIWANWPREPFCHSHPVISFCILYKINWLKPHLWDINESNSQFQFSWLCRARLETVRPFLFGTFPSIKFQRQTSVFTYAPLLIHTNNNK